jgi:uncharacterized protein YcbK (DUF882 family)
VPDQPARKTGYLNFRAGRRIGLAALLLFFGSESLESVIANGDTRTLAFHHLHTGEDLIVTYKRDGKFDEAALEKLNHLLRDWRVEEPIKMDPHLFDLLWEVNREVNGKEPIQIVCGYRAPSTNAMLRAKSRGVAQFSQHMLGKAMDFYIPGVELSQLRDMGLRLQRGGVGFYPTSGWPFVHLDTGNVRHWPKVTREYLARLFPDGKTVHIPEDGRPMPGFQLALAQIQARGKEVMPTAYASRGEADESDSGSAGDGSPMKRLFASIFNTKAAGGDDNSKIATVRTQPDAGTATNPKPKAAANARPVTVASLSSTAAPVGAPLQRKEPDSVAATNGTASLAPLPRVRPLEAGSNVAIAALSPNGRKVASAGEVTASLPLAITGGEKPTAALAYAAPEAVPQRTSAPVTPQTAAVAPRPRLQDVARLQEAVRSPGLYGDAAHSPSILFSKQPVQFTADLRHPDQSELAILLDPAATTAGYFAHQSGGKIVTGALTSAD